MHHNRVTFFGLLVDADPVSLLTCFFFVLPSLFFTRALSSGPVFILFRLQFFPPVYRSLYLSPDVFLLFFVSPLFFSLDSSSLSSLSSPLLSVARVTSFFRRSLLNYYYLFFFIHAHLPLFLTTTLSLCNTYHHPIDAFNLLCYCFFCPVPLTPRKRDLNSVCWCRIRAEQ